MDDRHERFTRLLSQWFIAVDVKRVIIEDLLNDISGAIIRCDGDPQKAMQVHVMPQDQALGCIGGFISED